MINAGILDVDMVLVKPQREAPDGTIVVARMEDEATCKRLRRQDGKILLEAENPAYEPITTDDAELVGVVKGVMRFLR